MYYTGCGFNSFIDSSRLLAELNAAFLMEMMDNSEDKNLKYRTEVNEALRWSGLMKTPLTLVHDLPDIRNTLMESGYYLLFSVFHALSQCIKAKVYTSPSPLI